MNAEQIKTNSSLFGGLGLAVLGTTCCALPIFLVALGMGSAVASLASSLPWLVALSEYKAMTFFITAVVLTYSGWLLRQRNKQEMCSTADGNRLKWQKRLLSGSAAILIASMFAAYALLPFSIWWETSS